MSLTYRHYPLASGVANLTHVNENLADISTWANGNIVGADLSSDAGILTTQLACNKQDCIATLKYSAAWPAASATTPRDLFPLPGLNGDEAWEITDYAWSCSDTGDNTAAFDIRYGRYTAGTWGNVGSIATGVVFTSGAAADTGGQGRNAARLSVQIAPDNTAPFSLALMSAVQGANALSAGILVVSVRMRRVLQSI